MKKRNGVAKFALLSIGFLIVIAFLSFSFGTHSITGNTIADPNSPAGQAPVAGEDFETDVEPVDPIIPADPVDPVKPVDPLPTDPINPIAPDTGDNDSEILLPKLPLPNPFEPLTSCEITSIEWSVPSIESEEMVAFRANAKDESCDGYGVEFLLVEEDLTGREQTPIPVTASFEGSIGEGSILFSKKFFGTYVDDFWEFGTGEFRLITGTRGYATGISTRIPSHGTATSEILSVALRGPSKADLIEQSFPPIETSGLDPGSSFGSSGNGNNPQSATVKEPEINFLDSHGFYNGFNTTLNIHGVGIVYWPNRSIKKDARFDEEATVWIDGPGWNGEYTDKEWQSGIQINLQIPKDFRPGNYSLQVVNKDNKGSNIVTFSVHDFSSRPKPQPIGMGCTNAWFIDRDCDGYGVGGMDIPDRVAPIGVPDGVRPLGKDANDFDPSINTPATARAKYGNLDGVEDFKAWIEDLTCLDIEGDQSECYTHTTSAFYFVSPNGNDATGTVNDPAKPFRNPNSIGSRLRAGDVVILRGGTYDYLGWLGFHFRPHARTVKGTKDQPILYIAAPGERVKIVGDVKSGSNAMVFNHGNGPNEGPQEHLIFDGIEINGKDLKNSRRRSAIALEMHVKDLIFRNMEVTRFNAGVFGSINAYLHDITFDSVVIHDSQGGQRQPEHGVYLNPSSETNPERKHVNFTFKDSLVYRRNRHGLQLRPTYENAQITRNIIHTNLMRGIEFKGSVLNSEMSNNLLFNNMRGGLLIDKENRPGHHGPIDNVSFIHNTVWLGWKSNGLGGSCWVIAGGGCKAEGPGGHAAVGFTQAGGIINFTNTAFLNNVIHVPSGRFMQNTYLGHLHTAAIQKNFIQSYNVHPRNSSLDLSAMWTRCLIKPDDGTEDYRSAGRWCHYPNSGYEWGINSFQTKGNRPQVFNNELVAPSEVLKWFVDSSGSYALMPDRFDFNPAAASVSTDNSVSFVSPKRDIKGNLRTGLPDSGAYEYGGPSSCTNGHRRNCNNQVGVCKGSQKICVGNKWPTCGVREYNYTGNYEITETMCDSLDNDCDGEVDEGCNLFDFSVSAAPNSGSSLKGAFVTSTITLNRTNKGEGRITLATPNIPAHVTSAFFPNFCLLNDSNPSCTALMRLDVSASAPTNTEAILVEGTSGSIKRDTTYTLNIIENFDFSLAVNPSSGSAVQGGYNETTVTITKTTTGSSGTVTLKALNNPSNITTTFYPSSCNFDNKKTSCTSRLRIDVGPQAKTGINTIAIEGTSGTTKKQTTYNLDVKKKILPGTPIITSIEPNRISNRIDTDISIKGENFTELAGLLIGTILLPIDKTIPINKTLIRYLATKGLTTGTYPIKVINLDLKESNSVNLIIEDTAATQKTLDTDLDGIPNLRDKCPRTPSKLHQRTKQGKSGCPLPNYGKFNKTITTNFTNITNPHQIPNFKIGIINKGQITFKENISITKVNLNYLRFEQINLEENIDIKKTSVRLDEQNIPTLNVKSEIELYNTSITNPVPTRNKKVCNDCKITNYNTKTTNTKIEVQGWSEYEITQGRCGDKYCSITETKNNCPNDCGKTGGSGGGGGGGSGGGGGGGSPSNTIKINLDDNKTHTKTIKEGTKIDLTLNGKIHQLEITKTENNTVTIHFKNISKILTTKTLELYSIDITLDNKKDIELYTTKTKNTHEITIKKIQQKNINEKDKKQNNTKNKKPTTKETPKTFKPTQTGLWILIIGIITIITTIITTKKKKRL